MLEQRPALEAELASLKQQIAETALAAYEAKPGGRENLAVLDTKIRTVTLQLDANAAAAELAQHLDCEAKAGWRAQIEAADPEQMVAGITKKACCSRCSDANGCVITGAQCGHPVLVGTVGPHLMGNPKVRALAHAAAKKLGVYR